MSRAAAAQADANLAFWPAGLPRPAIGEGAHVHVLDDAPWPTLLLRDGTEWVTVHSKRDPHRDAARQLDGVDAATASVLIVIGLGLGYLLDVLDERGWVGTVVALEPDPAIAGACLRRRDLRGWLDGKRLAILSGPTYEGLDGLIPSLNPNRADVVAVVNPVIGRVHREATEAAMRCAAKAWFGARANQEAKRQNGGRYLLNTLRNLRSIVQGGDAAALGGAFAGVPAVLVAAGPSLDRNLAEIAFYRDRVLLIAVDTALRPLLGAGIEPDLVVGVDPTEANARHLAELPPCPGTYFVSEGSLDPEAMPTFAGRTFYFRVTDHAPWPWLRQQGIDRGKLRAWGSVLTTAFDLALTMGCDPIAFTGADLAFTEGRPYARGTTYEEEWTREQAWGQSLDESWTMRLAAWPDTTEPGVDGQPVRTAPHLRAFRDWIVTEAGKATGRTIVNATPGGILSGPAVPSRPLAELLAGRAPLPTSTRAAIAGAYRSSAPTSELAIPTASPDTIGQWAHGANVSRESIEQAAGSDTRAADSSPDHVQRSVVQPRLETEAKRVEGTPRTPPLWPGLSLGDARFLEQLSASASLEWLVLNDPAQDLVVEVRERCRSLTPTQALVIVDELGVSVGAQVRRAIDAVLCERADLSLDYRRFVDHDSRLSVLRVHVRLSAAMLTTARASGLLQGPVSADAAKWDAAHRDVAARLAPVLATHFSPESVVDVGCGAGYWVEALAAAGVTASCGITPSTEGMLAPGILRAPLDAIPASPQRYGLCLCLEVAQHLDPTGQDALIASCTRLSDTVVFSSRPPGGPGGSPGDRPLRYWAEKFWRHGYVLDDTVRERIEHRWSLALTVYDGLVAFRRWPVAESPASRGKDPALTALVIDSVSRSYEQWLQKIWWSVVASDRNVPPPAVPDYPHPRLMEWRVPRVRLAAVPGGMRVFRFRSDAARWYLTHPAATLAVLEDGLPLDEHPTVDALTEAPAGWVRWRDEVTIKGSEGSDPRTNGRSYSLRLPSEVGWLESQPVTPPAT